MGNSSNRLDLDPERLPNPWIQRLFTCFRERGLDPTRSIHPITSQSTPHDSDPSTGSSRWLNARNFPGLEALLERIDQSSPQTSDELTSIRSRLCQTLPALKPVVKSSEEAGSSLAKRRRLMAAELFGISDSNATSSGSPSLMNSQTTSTGSTSQIASVGTIDPVGDFNAMIEQGDLSLGRFMHVVVLSIGISYNVQEYKHLSYHFQPNTPEAQSQS